MKYEVEIEGEQRSVEIKSIKDGAITAIVAGRELNCEMTQPEPGVYVLIARTDSKSVYEVRTQNHGDGNTTLRLMGTTVVTRVIDPKHRPRSADHGTDGRQQIISPMPGKVVRVLVNAGDAVKRGQGVIIIEAMKMQNELKSPKDGQVTEVAVSEGQTVAASQALITIE